MRLSVSNNVGRSSFQSTTAIYFMGGTSCEVHGTFSKAIGDAVGLGDELKPVPADEVKKTERLIEKLADPPADAE